MDSRERILTALRHQEADRVPFDLSATPVTGIHRVAYASLRRQLGLEERPVRVWHMMQQLAEVHDDVHQALETDARGLRPQAASAWTLRVRQASGYLHYVDEWGVERRMEAEGGYYYDLCGSPLAGERTVRDIEGYPFPDPVDPARLVGVRAAAEQAHAAGKAFVLGGICAGMLEMGQWLRGYESFFCDLAGDLPLAEALCDQITELKMRYWEMALSEVGDLVDVIQEGDDYGAQRGLQVSPALWRQVFKPRLARLIPAIKRRVPHACVFFHTCGSVRQIIPDLIEVGVDVLNPVQLAAQGMDSGELKREFGRHLTFWGGGVDTQRVLPLGTPEQVRDEVRRRLDDLAPGGGFVFAAVHNLQADVPAANIVAMRQALHDFGAY